MYINDADNLEQKSHQQLTTDNPGISLPPNGTNIIMGMWFYVHPEPRPDYDGYTEVVSQGTPLKVSNQYHQVWVIDPLSPGIIAVNVQQAKDDRYDDVMLYSDDLISEANANPYQGKVTDPRKNKIKVGNRINKSSNGKPKNDTDKDRDDVLADYTDDVMDADDSARDIIEDMDDAAAIYALDISAIVPWPLWNPPV